MKLNRYIFKMRRLVKNFRTVAKNVLLPTTHILLSYISTRHNSNKFIIKLKLLNYRFLRHYIYWTRGLSSHVFRTNNMWSRFFSLSNLNPRQLDPHFFLIFYSSRCPHLKLFIYLFIFFRSLLEVLATKIWKFHNNNNIFFNNNINK